MLSGQKHQKVELGNLPAKSRNFWGASHQKIGEYMSDSTNEQKVRGTSIYFWAGSDRSWPSRWQRQVGQIWTHRQGLNQAKIWDFQGNLLERSRIWEPENNIDIWQHRPSNSSTCHSICRLPPATSNSTNAWWLQMKICSRLKTHFKTMHLKEENWTWSKWMETSRCRSCRHRACLGMSSKQALGGTKLVRYKRFHFSKCSPWGTSQIVDLGIVWNPLDLAMTIPAAFREASSAWRMCPGETWWYWRIDMWYTSMTVYWIVRFKRNELKLVEHAKSLNQKCTHRICNLWKTLHNWMAIRAPKSCTKSQTHNLLTAKIDLLADRSSRTSCFKRFSCASFVSLCRRLADSAALCLRRSSTSSSFCCTKVSLTRVAEWVGIDRDRAVLVEDWRTHPINQLFRTGCFYVASENNLLLRGNGPERYMHIFKTSMDYVSSDKTLAGVQHFQQLLIESPVQQVPLEGESGLPYLCISYFHVDSWWPSTSWLSPNSSTK